MKAKATGTQKQHAGCNYSLPSFHRTIQPLWRVLLPRPQLPPPTSYSDHFINKLLLFIRLAEFSKLLTIHQTKPFLIFRSECSKNSNETSIRMAYYTFEDLHRAKFIAMYFCSKRFPWYYPGGIVYTAGRISDQYLQSPLLLLEHHQLCLYQEKLMHV